MLPLRNRIALVLLSAAHVEFEDDGNPHRDICSTMYNWNDSMVILIITNRNRITHHGELRISLCTAKMKNTLVSVGGSISGWQ
jgi:hypothetical protein